jgi:hypothetical protein
VQELHRLGDALGFAGSRFFSVSRSPLEKARTIIS